MSESNKSDILEFWNRYELLSSSNNYAAIREKSNICRYCNKTDKETSFAQNTHLLPELLGKNDVLTVDECDNCNKLFSDYESHLANFIRPYITLLGVKGKNKIPSFQSRTMNGNEETRTTFKHKEGNIKELHLQALDDYTINPKTKTVDIVFRKPPFVPLKVYKSLLKIGLSLLPVKYEKFNKSSFEWLVEKQEGLTFISQGYISSLKRKYFAKPSADLYRAKSIVCGNKEYPEHILILCFANQIIQIFLPFSEELEKVHDEKRQLVISIFPGIAYDEIKDAQTLEIKAYDFGRETSVKENHKISLSYENAEINIPSKEINS